MNAQATRTACVFIENWPVLAAVERYERAGQEAPSDIAVMEQHRVVAVSPAAAQSGVTLGMKKRAAEALCPRIAIVERDLDAEWCVFESVCSAVDTVASGIEPLSPGTLLLHARGPARHAGGEEALARALIDAVADLTGWECSVGIADGPLAAILASRSGRIVLPGESARFLAPFPIDSLAHAPVGAGKRFLLPGVPAGPRHVDELIGVLHRLGIASLGSLAALPRTSVSERFGALGVLLHTLARGAEISEGERVRPAQPILVERHLDPPLERVDQAAFIARPLAEELEEALRQHGLTCTRLRIVARGENGSEVERTWRHEGALSVRDVVDRVRWQCDGWILAAEREASRPGGPREGAPSAGSIVHLQLIPVHTEGVGEYAPGLWGHASTAEKRAARALTRVQSIAGERSVLVPAGKEGRFLREAVAVRPFRAAPVREHREGPWVGALPRPLPATVFTQRIAARLMCEGRAVYVSARGLLTGRPVHLVLIREVIGGHVEGAEDCDAFGRDTAVVGSPRAATAHKPDLREGGECTPLPAALRHFGYGTFLPIAHYGAPMLIDQRWWTEGEGSRRGARLQVVLESGEALALLSRERTWEVEALYD
ncbi:DNA polymerase Y family protein [Dermabacter sp. p3-SID358]|uniref:Y-family DNA polymerase n=1 Tax=Dermabacter sp. p3-SID358 TaxID=2916114 RepID=UPI0021A915A4|nr:DNA polymerase Y family protein [Dermabacter sp. p3-SID358]MCT1866082.1 DNA polymerase Y family protein [Dermabacter sp. p3-SID358]